jgi:hypothetical protein
VKADLTRVTFNPLKHFSRVLMQQGRVQLDADWNEQGAILLHALRRLAADLYGPAAGPADNLGFEIGALDAKLKLGSTDFGIGLGHYYVDGILCEAGATAVAIAVASDGTAQLPAGRPWTVDGQLLTENQYVVLYDAAAGDASSGMMSKIEKIDYAKRTMTFTNLADFLKGTPPARPVLQRFATYLSQPYPPAPAGVAAGLVYLDVWERAITYVEDDSIREVALNGPDTAARAAVIWQVKISGAKACGTPQDLADAFQPATRGRLRAKARAKPADTDPCTISPDARYRGIENQLYRVEIHIGNLSNPNDVPTFKWSRENGSVIFPILSGLGSETLALESLGRDDRFGLAEGDWVELQDDGTVLANIVSPLLQVVSIKRGARSVTLSGKAPSLDPAKHPLLRRWDQKILKDNVSIKDEITPTQNSGDKALQIPDGGTGWIELEDGVLIQFVDPVKAGYRSGDYWLIPARVATGDVEWPRETIPGDPPTTDPIARLPDGITHHYAPLATIGVGDKAVTVTGDCRWQLGGPAAFKAKRGTVRGGS